MGWLGSRRKSAWVCWLARMPALPSASGSPECALQRLHAGQLVGADDPLARRQGGSRRIQPADLADLRHQLGVGGGRQPVADAMGLERPLLSSRAAWRGEMAAMLPRATTSLATSRPVHWLIGRPEVAGASHASATIRQTCSAVIRHGPPGRGASARRSATPSSASGSGARASQRVRHARRVCLDPQAAGDLGLVLAARRSQDDPRAERHLLGGPVPPHQRLQRPPRLVAQRHHRWLRPARRCPLTRSLPCPLAHAAQYTADESTPRCTRVLC